MTDEAGPGIAIGAAALAAGIGVVLAAPPAIAAVGALELGEAVAAATTFARSAVATGTTDDALTHEPAGPPDSDSSVDGQGGSPEDDNYSDDGGDQAWG
ncbi:hypothetical protein ACQPXH_15805 [Nocardia sp. CA-135953]|uniref:hypothetical protein n=1 Tax=Nocardia sp. CA-135953 TaxID=3239978 RepID=UPI003D962F62